MARSASQSHGRSKTVFGLAEKGQQGILALRFRSHGDLVCFAKANSYEQDLDLQRWKISGVPNAAGIAGLSELLISIGWEVSEVVYQDADHAVFTTPAREIRTGSCQC